MCPHALLWSTIMQYLKVIQTTHISITAPVSSDFNYLLPIIILQTKNSSNTKTVLIGLITVIPEYKWLRSETFLNINYYVTKLSITVTDNSRIYTASTAAADCFSNNGSCPSIRGTYVP